MRFQLNIANSCNFALQMYFDCGDVMQFMHVSVCRFVVLKGNLNIAPTQFRATNFRKSTRCHKILAQLPIMTCQSAEKNGAKKSAYALHLSGFHYSTI